MKRLMITFILTIVLSKYCICVVFTNEFVFKLNDENNSEDLAKSIAEEDGHCTYFGKVGNVPNFYRMYCRPRIRKRGILFHNETFLFNMQSKYKISVLERQKLQHRVTRSQDPQWTNVWYLNGAVTPSMKIEDAWNKGKTGKNVVIGVVDDGIYMTHTDLDANLDVGNSYDYYAGDTDANPSSSSFSHGTKVSGLIAAEADNNECTIGVAYNSTLIGIRLLGSTSTTDSKEASSLSHNMANTDIYVNSWGPNDGSGFEGPGSASQAALQNGVNTGRGGKGSIFVWAAGNGGTNDHCNGDGYASSRFVITITAVTSSSAAASYAEVCSTVLAAAYSGDGTKNLISSIVPSGCASDLQGTSYAVPIAAGIIALALEANPSLTWRDIQHLIVYTSKQYSLSDSVSTWQKNGAQKYVSQVLGFGMLDADAMVTEAASWTNVPAQVSCDGTTESTSVTFQTTFMDAQSSLTGCNIQYLEAVSVDVSLSYSQYRGLILLTLVSPSGTESQILTRRPSDAASTLSSGTLTWTFSTVHFWGEEANGNWTLRFRKTTTSMTASITSWKLKVYGTSTDPLTGIDKCSSAPCNNNGTCLDKNYGYICTCSSSYTGDTCSTVVMQTQGSFVGNSQGDTLSDEEKFGISFGVLSVIIIVVVVIIIIIVRHRNRSGQVSVVEKKDEKDESVCEKGSKDSDVQESENRTDETKNEAYKSLQKTELFMIIFCEYSLIKNGDYTEIDSVQKVRPYNDKLKYTLEGFCDEVLSLMESKRKCNEDLTLKWHKETLKHLFEKLFQIYKLSNLEYISAFVDVAKHYSEACLKNCDWDVNRHREETKNVVKEYFERVVDENCHLKWKSYKNIYDSESSFRKEFLNYFTKHLVQIRDQGSWEEDEECYRNYWLGLDPYLLQCSSKKRVKGESHENENDEEIQPMRGEVFNTKLAISVSPDRRWKTPYNKNGVL